MDVSSRSSRITVSAGTVLPTKGTPSGDLSTVSGEGGAPGFCTWTASLLTLCRQLLK
ncbi:hypothetical protein J6590_063193 [Homalodisca vitripennis]|nr:hypothetical protein J6590_063193 [Homalodisca vitripennis]